MRNQDKYTKIDPPIHVEFMDGTQGLAILLVDNRSLIVQMEDESYVKIDDIPSEDLASVLPTRKYVS